jgi:hypothetical protein
MEEEKIKARTTLRQARSISRASTGTVWGAEEVVRENDQLRATSMNFKLYKCVGGHVLETSAYNRRNDENEHNLYMIKEEDDFAKQVAQAIMLEQMKL